MDAFKKYTKEQISDAVMLGQHGITVHLLDKIDEAMRANDQVAVEYWMGRYHHFMIIHGVSR